MGMQVVCAQCAARQCHHCDGTARDYLSEETVPCGCLDCGGGQQ